ncbi:hypothetical protein ES695_02465 [Candidatus Atribacteria bacterium 1244-E10-H5-B2]|nr:MAG: hypothetical protein ES695_02465 [Candidatus Atribacteria bacterium 1244-E10-H5-B2]
MFTRKHFKGIANILKKMYPVKSDLECTDCFKIRANQYQKLIDKFVSYFRSENHSFNKKKFLKAIEG